MTPIFLLFKGKFVLWYFCKDDALHRLARSPTHFVLDEPVLASLEDEAAAALKNRAPNSQLYWGDAISLDPAHVTEVLEIRKDWEPLQLRTFVLFHRDGTCRWGSANVLQGAQQYEPERYICLQVVGLTQMQDARLHVFHEQLMN
jgi:hypothetical protein